MRRTLTLTALLLTYFCTFPLFHFSTSAQTSTDEIRSLTLAVNAAYQANDLDKYFSYYTEDLTQFWPSGRVTLQAYRDQWTKFVKGGGRIELAEVSDLQVQMHPGGDSAVATYLLKVRTRTAKGDVSEETNQETDVWFRQNGTWKIVHLHYSPARAGR